MRVKLEVDFAPAVEINTQTRKAAHTHSYI